MPRPIDARRSWLFVPGADRSAAERAAESGADVIMQELEDFTTPQRRPEARRLCAEFFQMWRVSGALAAIRINPLTGPSAAEGRADLAAAMAARPDIVLMPKVTRPEEVRSLARAVARHEFELGIPLGSTELVPNVEGAAGLARTRAIATADPRVTACLVASEDMAADLGAERAPDGQELAWVRAAFHADCTAVGVLSIDCPYTWSDIDGCAAETRAARRLGYGAKSAVLADHVAAINQILTPAPEEVAEARRIVEAFDLARKDGLGRVELDGYVLELPAILQARRVLERAESLGISP